MKGELKIFAISVISCFKEEIVNFVVVFVVGVILDCFGFENETHSTKTSVRIRS